MFVGACRVGRAYLRLLEPDGDRRDPFIDATKLSQLADPLHRQRRGDSTMGSSPRMSVADTGIVPGEPSGRPTTKNSVPSTRLKPMAGRSRPNKGCTADGDSHLARQQPPKMLQSVAVPSGTGKTHLLEALGHAAIDVQMTVAWFSVEDLGALMRRHRVDDTVSKVFASLASVALVIVDDIGLLPDLF